jgi:hypothetical protein
VDGLGVRLRTQAHSGVGLATLMVLAGCSPTSLATGSPSPNSGSPSPALPACTMTATSDPYDGFRIGVPDGWDLFTLNGTIFVSKSANSTELAVVRPALMSAGETPASFFESALTTLQNQVAVAGLTMTHTAAGSGAGLPQATLTVQSAQGALAGMARLEVLPYATGHGTSIIALLASWAPAAGFSAESPLLTGIWACYAPQPGTLYQVVRDQVFTYAIPLGWQAKNETQDTIDITSGNDAVASYALTLAPLSSGVNSAPTLLTWAFGKIGVRIGTVLFQSRLPDQTLPSGAVAGAEIVEFTGSLNNGTAVHGMVDVESTSGPGGTGGVIRLGVANANRWNALNGALIHIMGSIQHNITQDLRQWEQLSRQWQAFGQQVQGFDDALNGVDLVHDPTTGATFEAPYSAFNQSGPDGPGYYSPANNKLQIQTP